MKTLASRHAGGVARAAGSSGIGIGAAYTASASASSSRLTIGRATPQRHLQTHSSNVGDQRIAPVLFGSFQSPASSNAHTALPAQVPSTYPSLAPDFFSPRRPSAMAKRPRRTVSFSPSSAVLKSTPPPRPTGGNSNSVTDHEFEVRLGRAVSLLRATLSDFMRIGLVDYDTSHVTSSSSSSGLGFPSLDSLGLGAILGVFGATARAKERHRESLPPHLRTDADCPVYHPDIVFKFHPPTTSTGSSSEGHPDSRSTGADGSSSRLLTFSGRTMYFGSAHILRHALGALFSETTVLIERVRLQRGSSGNSANMAEGSSGSDIGKTLAGSGSNREATLILRLTFTGVVRVTQQVHDYAVIFRYRFDPESGMIIEHEVDKIEPAPGKKIWAGLSAAFSRLAGFQQPAPAPSPCHQTNRSSPTWTSLWEGYGMTDAYNSARASGESRWSRLRPALDTTSDHRSGMNRSGSLRTSPEWRGRRLYTTQSRAASSASSTASPATSETASQQRFFSHPRSAEDMPGPSLASIWVPSLGASRNQEQDLKAAQSLSVWAPASNDPSVVAPATGEATPPVDLSLYRPAPPVGLKSIPKIVFGLSKSNLTFLVTLTGMAGYALCPSVLAVSSSASFLGPVGTLLALATGTALCSGAANAINQLREIPYDAQMARTRNRLLPSRAITPLQAASFAGVSTVGGVATLAMLNPLTAFLGLANIFLYAFVYTPMKRRHIANTWVGAIVGALPPLMGWAACTGTLDLATDAPAWCLAALLFAWQFPHFNSLSHNLSSEYARGGYRMMSVTDPALNRRTSLRYALALLPICSVALPLSGAVAALPYALLSLPPNLVLIQAAWGFWRKGTEKSARWCFWVSLIHLPAVMILAMATKKSLWDGVAEWIASLRGEESEEMLKGAVRSGASESRKEAGEGIVVAQKA